MARGNGLKRKTLTLTKKRRRDVQDFDEKVDTIESSMVESKELNRNESALRSVGTKHLVYHREKFPCKLINFIFNNYCYKFLFGII